MRIFRIAAAVVLSAIGLALIAIAPALAADPLGTWLTGDKKGKVRIVNCGGAICGTSSGCRSRSIRRPTSRSSTRTMPMPSKQGRPLLGIPIVLNMKPSGSRQMGRASLQSPRTATPIPARSP